jgi:hypothetical protein
MRKAIARFPKWMVYVLTLAGVTGCAPEVGSESWCKSMEEKPKTEWSIKDAGSYATSCVITVSAKVGSEQWCKDIVQKPKADWSANDAKNYATQCLLP